MNKETKKQLFSVFVLVTFLGSSIAFAVLSSSGQTANKTESPYVVDHPLTNQEEVPYLQQGAVLMKYFYTEDCITCNDTSQMVLSVADYFKGKLVVEFVDKNKYVNESQELNITKIPTMYLKGKSIDIITEDIQPNALVSRICYLFFNIVPECNI